MAGGQAREAAAGGSAAAPPSSALDDETYPRWCLTAMMVVTFIAFFSHAAPTDWLRGTRPAAHIVAAQDSSVSTELFAAPSALPHAAVLEEVSWRALLTLRARAHAHVRYASALPWPP